MPRALEIGNGNLFVNFDNGYVLRDMTWPHVGSADHTKGNPWRFGFWVQQLVPYRNPAEKGAEQADSQFAWSDAHDFEHALNYVSDTLITDVLLTNERLGIKAHCQDLVHYRRDIYLRKVEITNLRNNPVEIRLFFHHNPYLKESADCNTVIYHPRNKSLVAYKDDVYVMANVMLGREIGFHSYACGVKGINGMLGTYMDALDGNLARGSVAQGSVDSTGAVHFRLEPGQSQTMYYWMSFGKSLPVVRDLDAFVVTQVPERLLQETESYWRFWVTQHRGKQSFNDVCQTHASPCRLKASQLQMGDLGDLAGKIYRRSLLTVRANADGSGAIIAAIDSDILQFARDVYSYCWPRDGSFCAAALDAAGHGEIPRSFFDFCASAITEDGYMPHKLNPNGTVASSWHSLVGPNGQEQLPIQEDETALPVVALWQHYKQHGCTELIYETDRNYYGRLAVPAANFLMSYREPHTGLPQASGKPQISGQTQQASLGISQTSAGLPQSSNDLWEERWGIHAFTVATVYAGLKAAANLGQAVNDPQAGKWDKAAEEIKAAFIKHFYNEPAARFVRMVTVSPDGQVQQDLTIDASMFAIWYMGMLPADDPRVVRTMEAIEGRLWVKTPVGGIARYENDYYHQVSQDVQKVAGNPWIICTLWVAQWHIARAKSLADLARAKELIGWVIAHASPGGLFAEQLDPNTGAPLSVSPLTWSHAMYILTVTEYALRYGELSRPVPAPAAAAR